MKVKCNYGVGHKCEKMNDTFIELWWIFYYLIYLFIFFISDLKGDFLQRAPQLHLIAKDATLEIVAIFKSHLIFICLSLSGPCWIFVHKM